MLLGLTMRDPFGYRKTRELAELADGTSDKVERHAIPFQPDAVEVELKRLPYLARVSLYTILFLIMSAIGWAAWAQIDRTVTARGKLVSQSRTVVKQPYQPSVIRSLDAKAGDYVKEGNLIASLDPTLTKADRGQLQAKIRLLELEGARLEAEQSGLAFRPEQTSDLSDLQLELFKRRQLEKDATLEKFHAQVQTLDSQIEVARAQASQFLAQKELARIKLGNAEKLLKSNAGSRIRFQEASAEAERLEAAQVEKEREQERYASQKNVVQVERELFLSSYALSIEERMLAIATELEQLRFDLQKIVKMGEFDEFRADSDGIILEVTNKSVGSVVEAAEVLFTFVPTNKGLDVELDLTPQDIGWVHVGQPVRIKLDPFPFQRHGTLEGELASISPDALQDQSSGQTQVYYKARVSITGNKLRNLPSGFELLPGITSTAEIKIGKRSILSYLTDPFHKALDESLKEPN